MMTRDQRQQEGIRQPQALNAPSPGTPRTDDTSSDSSRPIVGTSASSRCNIRAARGHVLGDVGDRPPYSPPSVSPDQAQDERIMAGGEPYLRVRRDHTNQSRENPSGQRHQEGVLPSDDIARSGQRRTPQAA